MNVCRVRRFSMESILVLRGYGNILQDAAAAEGTSRYRQQGGGQQQPDQIRIPYNNIIT